MGAEFQHAVDAAAEEQRRLAQRGCVKALGVEGGEAELFKLIHVPAALYAAVVGRLAKVLRGQVHAEYAALADLRVGVALLADGHGDHRRIGIDDARPADGDHVLPVKAGLRALAGDQHRRQRGEEGGRADGAELIVGHGKAPWVLIKGLLPKGGGDD